MNDSLVIAGKSYGSRLLVGTGKYKDFAETREAIDASGAEIVTVAIRRTNIGQNPDEPNLLDALPEDIGCAAIMPLASLIGSGMGILNPWNLRLIIDQSKVPVIVDAGVGTASDAAIAMELGCDGVLMNTAIALANKPVQMAQAMRLAIDAGRMAYLAGRMPRKLYSADPSSPTSGLIGS